jgi:hypothetical protein
MLAGNQTSACCGETSAPFWIPHNAGFTCLSIHHTAFLGNASGRKVQRAAMFMQKAEKRFQSPSEGPQGEFLRQAFLSGMPESVAIPGSFPERNPES